MLCHVSSGPEEDECLGASYPRQSPKEDAQPDSLEMGKRFVVLEHGKIC